MRLTAQQLTERGYCPETGRRNPTRACPAGGSGAASSGGGPGREHDAPSAAALGSAEQRRTRREAAPGGVEGPATLPLTITIPGPVAGKGRPRFVRATGRAFTPVATTNAETRLAHEVALLWKHPPLDEALSMALEVRVAVPASKSKKFRAGALAGFILPVGKPDLDNIVKLVGDSLNDIVWTDDSRIASIIVRRRYSEHPGLTLTVSRA